MRTATIPIITLPRAVVEQALEALEIAAAELDSPYTSETPEERVLRAAITSLRSALAEQAEPDSPARRCGGPGCDGTCCQPVQEPFTRLFGTLPVYGTPPQRKPLPKHNQHCVDVPGYGLMAVRLVRAVERAHGIKE